MIVLLLLVVLVFAQDGQIPFDIGGVPEPVREYRTFSGYGNNKANPNWGQAYTPYSWDVLSPNFYPRGAMEGLDPNRVNERLASTLTAKATEHGRPLVDNLLNQLHTEWGHLMTVDLTNTANTELYQTPVPGCCGPAPPGYPLPIFPPPAGAGPQYEYVPVRTDINDWDIDEMTWIYPGGTPGQPPYVLALSKYNVFPGTGNGTATPRVSFNTQSHYLDGSSIYGVNDQFNNAVFNPFTGYLFVEAPWVFPVDPIAVGLEPPSDKWRYAADSRYNKHPGLRALMLLFQLEHNRLVREMRAQNPHWTPMILFQEARRQVIAVIQAISMREYLASTVGNPLPPYTGYKANVDATIDILFATSTFRYGHSEVRSELMRLEKDLNTPCAGGPVLIRDIIFLPHRWYAANDTGIAVVDLPCYIRGFAATLSGKVDIGFVDDMRNFFLGGARHGSDLLTYALFRAHEAGLPDYNTIRQAFGLLRKDTFAQITSNVKLQQALLDIYGPSLDNIDPIVGMLSEDHVAGAATGELVRVSFLSTMTRLRDGDRFWYEGDYFEQSEIEKIHAIKLQNLFENNFGMQPQETPLSSFFVTQRQLDKPVTGDDLFLFPPLISHPDGLTWYTTLLAPFYQLSWAIQRRNGPQVITFQIQTRSTGWVGLGFKPEPNTMKGADIVLCRISDVTNQPECRDSKAFYVGEPLLDTVVGGTDNINLLHYKEGNGFTTVVFSRLVDTGDVYDWEITDDTKIIFAFNPTTNALRYHGPTRSSTITLDFQKLYIGPPTRVYISVGISIWLYIMAAIGIVQCLVIIAIIGIKHEYFKFQSPEFCVLICIGAIMSHIATILILIPEPTDGMFGLNFGCSVWDSGSSLCVCSRRSLEFGLL